jgi:hypothetical protein
MSEREAQVVSVIADGKWMLPWPTGEKLATEIAMARPPYTLLPSISLGTSSTREGRLQGTVRKACGYLHMPLAAASPVRFGFAVAGKGEAVHPLPLRPISVSAAQSAAIAGVLQRVSGIGIKPTITAAYSVDLDANGKPDFVVQSTHPDLEGDIQKYRREYHSIIVVLPDRPDAKPTYVGYLQHAGETPWGFEVFALDSVADLDGDKRVEFIVNVRHVEGFQTRVFRYRDESLQEVFRSVGGEGDTCGGKSERGHVPCRAGNCGQGGRAGLPSTVEEAC